MDKPKRVYKRYFTKEKKDKINPSNIKAYDKYLRSSIIKNEDVKNTTFKTYRNYFTQFLVFLSEEQDNMYILSDEFQKQAVDIMEEFIYFLTDKLGNNKKVINTKISTVSSYYFWALKRGIIEKHPFANKLDRMKNANDEHLINHYFLTDEEVAKVTKELKSEIKKGKDGKYDIQDLLIWSIALDSANRNGALSKLTWSSLDLKNMMFTEIREKEGYMRDVAFSEETRDLLIKWQVIRTQEMDNLECDGIFVYKRNKKYHQMSQTSLYMRVRKIGHILGLEDLHPHCLRKTTLNGIVEKTHDLTLAAQMANHKSTETTNAFYVKPKSKAEVREQINKAMAELRKKKK